MNKPRYDWGIVIGRFQPFHHGHLALLERAHALARRTVVIIGSHRSPTSIRNPWTTDERIAFIKHSLGGMDIPLPIFVPVQDSDYDVPDWTRRVGMAVESLGQGSRVLVGHDRDESSFYLKHFPGWDLENVEDCAGGVSASALRAALFEGRHAVLYESLHQRVVTDLIAWLGSPEGHALSREYRYAQIAAHKAGLKQPRGEVLWLGRYALVQRDDAVLAIRRGTFPGRGRLVLPGSSRLVNQHDLTRLSDDLKSCKNSLSRLCALMPSGVTSKDFSALDSQPRVFDQRWRDPARRELARVLVFIMPHLDAAELRAGAGVQELVWLSIDQLDRHRDAWYADFGQIAGRLLRDFGIIKEAQQ